MNDLKSCGVIYNPTTASNGPIQTQPPVPESDGSAFMSRLSVLQERINRVAANLEERLGPILCERSGSKPEVDHQREPGTAYFSEANGFLNNVESDIDRLCSILNRLEN